MAKREKRVVNKCLQCVEYFWRDMSDNSWHKECRLKECHFRQGPGKDTITERRLSRTGHVYWYTPSCRLTKREKADRLRRADEYKTRLAEAEGSFMLEEFEALVDAYEHRCGYCGKHESEVGVLSPDHMIPIVRGGSNFVWDIIPACRHCNDSKGSKTMVEYLIWLER